jgi:hypothetical protein
MVRKFGPKQKTKESNRNCRDVLVRRLRQHAVCEDITQTLQIMKTNDKTSGYKHKWWEHIERMTTDRYQKKAECQTTDWEKEEEEEEEDARLARRIN